MSRRPFEVTLSIFATILSQQDSFSLARHYDPLENEIYILCYVLSEKSENEFLEQLSAVVIIKSENNSRAQTLLSIGLN